MPNHYFAAPSEQGCRNLVIVGAGDRGRDLARAIERHPELGYRLIGFVEDDSRIANDSGNRILGTTAELPSIIERHAVDEVIIAAAPSWQETLMRYLVDTGRESSVQVRVFPSLFEAMIAGMHFSPIEDIPLGQISPSHTTLLYQAGKRTLDILASIAMLIMLAPLAAVMCALIRLTSPGPILFEQKRVGLMGRVFNLYKLRTMVADAEKYTGPKLADPYDERVTTIGKFMRATRMDEVPQFINVLLGEMSIVGPRPERPEFVRDFMARIPSYIKRLEVKPGITGLAQVYGGYHTSVQHKVRYDWYYVYRRSLALDLRIILLTAGVVLRRAGS